MIRTKKFKNEGFLPYYRGKSSRQEAELSVYLRRKFLPLVRRQFPQHGLVQHQPAVRLAYIRKHSKTHRFFLRFDVKQFYPSVSQPGVAAALLENYRRLSGITPPTRMQQRVNRGFSSFFAEQPYRFGLPMATRLSVITGQALLLGVCAALSEYPFLCFQDDFLVLLPSRAEVDACMCRVVVELDRLGLTLNPAKLSAGRIAGSVVSFTGFRFAGGAFGIDAVKEETFRAKIKSMTSLTCRYSCQAAFIKMINRAVCGFGHYYKHASVRLAFAQLDAYIRQRVRRYLVRTRAAGNNAANLNISNELLHTVYGLRSLVDIFDGLKRPVATASVRRAQPVQPAFTMTRTEELLVHQIKLLKELLNVERDTNRSLCNYA